MADLLQFPTFVIGPRSQGRGYHMLSKRVDFPGSTDLAMILMAWARTGEPEFFGRILLRGEAGQSVLFRAARLKRGELGERAFMHGVLLDAADIAALDHRPELLFDLKEFARPDGTTGFGDATLSVPRPEHVGVIPANDIDKRNARELGLAWNDRLMVVPEPEHIYPELRKALSLIHPAEQRPRITGWVTSARLVPRGPFSLLRDSQLIVTAAPFDEDLPGHLRFEITPDEIRSERAEPPASWRALEAFQALFLPAALETAMRRFEWRMDRVEQTGEEVVDDALVAVADEMPIDQVMVLLRQMKDGADPVLAAAARQVYPRYTAKLADSGMSQEQINALDASPLELLQEAHVSVFQVLGSATLSAMVEEAIKLAQSGKLAGNAQLRSRLMALLRVAIPTFESGASSFDRLTKLVKLWPPEAQVELLPLTLDDSLKMILAKSWGLGAALLKLLGREHFWVDVEKPFRGWHLAVNANNRLTGKTA